MTKVFVHGNPETEGVWEPLVQALSDRGLDDMVVLLSPPGFGAPVPAGWDPGPAGYVAWLADRLAGIGGHIDLVGHDWGAGHVFGLLSFRPDLVRSWAADCAGLLHPEGVWHDMAQVWQTPGAGEEAIAAMAALGNEERQVAYEGLGLPPGVAGPMAEAFDDDMGRCILALYRGAPTAVMADLGRRLGEADLPPGLVIDATEDAYVSSALTGQMAEPLGAERLTLEGRGHWWMVEDPAGAAEGLLAFWAGLDEDESEER